MKTLKFTGLVLILTLSLSMMNASAENQKEAHAPDTTQLSEKEKLVVVWTSGDKEVALKMVFMYTLNAKKNGWWKDITLLVWGPSAKLLSEDKDLQDYLKKMKDAGVNLLACKGCADQYGVAEKLTNMGVTVRYTGVDLTNFIKERHVVTF